MPSASPQPKDLSSTSSTLLNCTPSAQGSPILKLRLPTSLDSLKPTIFHAAWIPDIRLVPINEPGERTLISQLIDELNRKFDVNLESNFSTSRDVEPSLDGSATESMGNNYIIVGSSHTYRLAAALTQQGESVTCLAGPSWCLTGENIASTALNLEEAVRANPSAIVIFQMLDSSIYFSSSEEGEITLPKRAADGRYHVPGELVLADWSALKKIFTTSLPLIRAGGTNKKLILSPLPRYINSKCCDSESHITNFGGKAYTKGMGKQLADIHGWLDDLAHGKRLQSYEIICPSTFIGLAENATLKDKAEREKLRDRWGTDPVHLIEVGYATLAEALTVSCMSREELGKIEAPTLPKDTTNRRDGVSRSDWTARGWDSMAATTGQSRKNMHRGRKDDVPGRPGKRHRR